MLTNRLNRSAGVAGGSTPAPLRLSANTLADADRCGRHQANHHVTMHISLEQRLDRDAVHSPFTFQNSLGLTAVAAGVEFADIAHHKAVSNFAQSAQFAILLLILLGVRLFLHPPEPPAGFPSV
jgi:hypothetical protein